MINSKETIERWITMTLEQGRNLSKWEDDFIHSIDEQFQEKGWLSDKQEEILERIYSEKTP